MTSVHVPSRRADGVRIFLRPGDVAQSERRQHQRFPITVQAQRILAGDGAQAAPVDISCGAVFLNTNKSLRLAESIRDSIDWPVLLDQRCRFRLLIVGKVLLRNGGGTAAEIMRYEFGIPHQTAAPVAA
jgi:hypothetical protein